MTHISIKWFVPSKFEWALYLHEDAENGGLEYHIHKVSGQWLAGHRKRKGICRNDRLSGLFGIGSILVSEMMVHRIITEMDKSMNDNDDLTCKSWVGRAVEKVIEAKALDIGCGWKDLKDAVFQFAAMHWQSAFENVQLRPTASLGLGTTPAQEKACVIC